MDDKKREALPFETKMGFTAIPNAVCKFYVRHPRFTPKTERVYRYLLQRYNDNYGCAWPSFSAIRYATNIASQDTVNKALNSLEHLGLIERHNRKNENGWDNNYYVLLPPIEDEDEFYRKFGDELPKKYQRKQAEETLSDDIDELDDWL